MDVLLHSLVLDARKQAGWALIRISDNIPESFQVASFPLLSNLLFILQPILDNMVTGVRSLLEGNSLLSFEKESLFGFLVNLARGFLLILVLLSFLLLIFLSSHWLVLNISVLDRESVKRLLLPILSPYLAEWKSANLLHVIQDPFAFLQFCGIGSNGDDGAYQRLNSISKYVSSVSFSSFLTPSLIQTFYIVWKKSTVPQTTEELQAKGYLGKL